MIALMEIFFKQSEQSIPKLKLQCWVSSHEINKQTKNNHVIDMLICKLCINFLFIHFAHGNWSNGEQDCNSMDRVLCGG